MKFQGNPPTQGRGTDLCKSPTSPLPVLKGSALLIIITNFGLLTVVWTEYNTIKWSMDLMHDD